MHLGFWGARALFNRKNCGCVLLSAVCEEIKIVEYLEGGLRNIDGSKPKWRLLEVCLAV